MDANAHADMDTDPHANTNRHAYRDNRANKHAYTDRNGYANLDA